MNIKMFFSKFFGIAFALFVSQDIIAKNEPNHGELNPSTKCVLGVINNKLMAGFPVLDNKQNIWAWNKKNFHVIDGYNSMNFDYSWIIELGDIEKGKFEATTHAFGIGHLNAYYYGKDESHGTISDLIDTMKAEPGIIYYNNSNGSGKKYSEKIRNFPIYIDYGDEIMLYSKSLEVMKILLSDHPVYAHMIMMTPYSSQSYSCTTKIYYSN